MSQGPSPFRRFLTELRSRHVVRVGLVYGAVAVAVMAAASDFFPALRLPEWSVTLVAVLLLLGLPVALVLAWAFEITPDGVKRAEPWQPAGAGARSPRRVGGRVRLGGVAALLVLLAIVGRALWLERPATAAGTGAASTIAVLPFSVRAGPELEYLGDGMVDLLGRNLDGMARLRSLDPSVILNLIASEGTRDLDPQQAGVLAERAGAGLFVLGSIVEAGGQLRITAALYDRTRPSRPLAKARIDGHATDVFELVDRLTAQLVAEQPFGAVSARLTRTAAGATRSLPAFKAYLEAEQAFRAGAMEPALAGYQRAIAEDTSFALAYYRLASAYWWSLVPDKDRRSREAVEQALARRDRLGERDRRLVDAFGALHHGTADEAERRYAAVLEDYPDDAEAQFQLADLLHHYNAPRGRPPAEARQWFDRVLAVDPKFACPI